MISRNLSQGNNIDDMIDLLIKVQKENGVEPTIQEALFDPNTKEKLSKFRRRKLEEAGVDLSDYGLDNKCNGCDKKRESNIARGIFVFNEDDLYDEEDGGYVCEYCTKISYDGSYRPDVCDTCTECESCTEFRSEECDGCQYSTLYNGGSSYGQISDEEYHMNDEDIELFNELEEDIPDYEKELPDGSFSIVIF